MKRKVADMGDNAWLARQFEWNERLGIPVPSLKQEWETMSRSEQTAVLEMWETVRGGIPDRILRFEDQIKVKQDDLSVEENFGVSCRLNWEIAGLASRINDLHIWFRTRQDLEEETKRHG